MKRDNMTENVIYEDEIAVALLESKPAAEGHVTILPKRYVKSMEDLSEEESEHLFFVASYTATMLFETLGAHGTNIITHEGEEFYIDVISRKQEDGLDFQWKPKQIPTSEMDTVKEGISNKIIIGKSEEPKHPPVMEEKAEEQKEEVPVPKVEDANNGQMSPEDYFLNKLQRIP